MARAACAGHTDGMFPFLVALLAGGVIWAGFAVQGREPIPLPALALGLVGLVSVAAVVFQWLTHPDAVKDFMQGGIVDMARRSADRVDWYDRAVFMTRRGIADRRTGLLHLERRVLFGLIPLGTVTRPLGEFYRVEVLTRVHEQQRRRRGYSGFGLGLDVSGDDRITTGFTFTINLIDRRGDRLCALDLTTGTNTRTAERFLGALREALEDLVGRVGEGSRGAAVHPDRPLPSEPGKPPAIDFEAWRAKRGSRPLR